MELYAKPCQACRRKCKQAANVELFSCPNQDLKKKPKKGKGKDTGKDTGKKKKKGLSLTLTVKSGDGSDV